MSIGSISSASLSSLASNIFNKIDSKQQGYLDETDLQSAFGSVSGDSSSVSSLFNQMDSDGDGQITETEFSDGVQTLVDALQSQLQQSRVQGSGSSDGMNAMGDMPPPPPPPEASGTDEGYTQDELTSMSSELASTDSRMSTLMSNLAANFDSADTNGDGKITHDEAMAFDQSQQASSTSSTTGISSASSTSSTDGTSTDNSLQMMAQLLQLLQAYNTDSSTSSVSVAA